ncbi:hypothetical protein [Alicyclobacillus sendaiensis]|uniref:Uncharacterized protein n=1 Tax=Alicyclobacillus sendaiensis PA2 TaxID=3029425 RepID=A0ABT6XU08_ALISE|nr:hypothetical protein [Alicyclobacillus sendaiensis]MDI9258578.1 hypothetical protein [Alicyclobacillus sendaiensis PA2]
MGTGATYTPYLHHKRKDGGKGVLQLLLDMGMGALVDLMQWVIQWIGALP